MKTYMVNILAGKILAIGSKVYEEIGLAQGYLAIDMQYCIALC